MPSNHRSAEVTALSLAGIEIFSTLNFDQRLAIARACSAGVFPKRTPVLTVEDESSDVYFVISGRVRATIYSLAGKEVAFRDIGQGLHFGDVAAIDGERRSANVVTLEKSLLAWMPGPRFWEVINTHPPVAAALLKGFATLVRQLSERVVEFSTLGAANRLHAELLRLAREQDEDANSVELPHPPTHAELASRISSHREAVSREMQRLAEAGVVDKGRGKLLFRDLERLQSMVDEVKGT